MKKLFYVLALTLGFSSCEKYRNASDFKGKFTGTLKVAGPDYLQETPAELWLADPQYELTQNGEKFGSGTFDVKDRTTITFADTNAWTNNFDLNTVLNGTYSYQTLGDSLILTKVIISASNQKQYQYRLKSVKN